jgi:hypothetical protein
MKKLIPIFFLLIVPISLSAQWSGDGLSPSSAFYGIINSRAPMIAWNTGNFPSGVIYVGRSISGQEDLEVGTGGTLTIEQGITIRFCTTLSDLLITGSGVLNASSASKYGIVFTRNAQASWGHISFQTMSVTAGQSTIRNCVIEYGNVSTAPGTDNPYHYGGGIQADFSNLIIANCEIRNNRAGWGGGIFVGDGKNPSISNCYIHDNIATTSGGGIYFWKNSFSTTVNCIITTNVCNGAGGGGGIFLGGTAKNVRIINCLVSGNTANNQSLGHNVKIFNNTATPKPQFINSIIWSPANSIVYVSSTPTAQDFLNCAIQDPPSTFQNTVSLNAANEGQNPSGPFFANMTVDSWPLQVFSPCMNAGTTSGAPSTDYIGNGRIGVVDIGPFEVQYCRWNGSVSTLWSTSANWENNIDPNSGTFDVIIPSGLTNYPTGEPSAGYVIPLNKSLVLYPGARLTLNSLRNNGKLILQSDANGISSLIVNSNVTARVDLYLTGGNPGAPSLKLNKWHYISTPISSLPVSTFAPVPTKNVAKWYDDQVSGSLATGWINYYGYRYSSGLTTGPTFSSLDPGIGYDYYAATDEKYTFSGALNHTDITIPLSFSANDALHGFNLLGNPFPSGLNWDDIVNGTYFPYPAQTSKSLFFTRDNAQCSYINGVGIPSDVNGIIPPMQGFFVKTSASGNSLTIPAAARVQDGIHARYKGLEVIPLVRLVLNENTLSDETVVRFDETAKPGLDYDFDAPKMFLSADVLSIYSVADGKNFAINGIPFPDTVTEVKIVVNLLSSGNHTINATELQALEKYNITLTDKTSGFIANLQSTPSISFSGDKGTAADRFVLRISKIATGFENPAASSAFNIYQSNRMINIQTASDLWEGKSGTIKILDLTGKTVTSVDKCEFRSTSLIQVAAPDRTGMYIIELRSGLLRHVGKVVIR